MQLAFDRPRVKHAIIVSDAREVLEVERQLLSIASVAEVVRTTAHSGEPFGTFRGLLCAYAEARPGVLVSGLPLATSLRGATSSSELVDLVLSCFDAPTALPAVLVVEHLERADLESLLLFTALAARPPARLAIRGTCAWADIPRASPVASLLLPLSRRRRAEQEAERKVVPLFRERDAAFEERRRSLPPRQAETLEWLLRGEAAKEISERMNLSVHTVNQYTKSIFRTLGVRSRAQLLALQYRGPRRLP